MEFAFDGQPVLSEVTGEPMGGNSVKDAPYYAGRYGYIDFGPEWSKVRITATWTKYRTWSAGDQTPYAELWWDDDNDIVNDSGLNEPNINFNTAKGLNTRKEEPWIRDFDGSKSPITPKARYLICHAAFNMTNRAKEYAIVGCIGQSEPSWPEALNTYILPVQGKDFIHFADVQRDLPHVDWKTLDRLYIPAGDYRFMKLMNLPKRSPDRPLIITNYGGKVRIGSDHYYAASIGGGSNWILTGRYSQKNKTGHPDYPGHLNGNYANSAGKYGIEISHTASSGLSVGGRATNFELEFMEVAHVGFAGLLIKTDNVPDAHMDGVKIHDLYIHDSESEGVYIGNTSKNPNEQHKFTNLEFYNNRIIRSGTEGLQLSNMGDGVHIHHNVVILNALDWKNPFQRYQEGCFQYSARDGKASIHDNIFIGGSGNLFLVQFSAAVGETLTPGEDEVHIYQNYFSHGRNCFSYILRTESNKVSALKFEKNWIRQINFHHNEILPDSKDYNVMFRAFNNKYNPLYIKDNLWEGDQVFIDVINGANGTKDNVFASGNQNTVIEPIIFMDKTFPSDFDYNRIERWDDYSDLYSTDIYFEKGDFVYHEGILYECIKEGKHTGMEPSKYPDVWKVHAPMTDDFRLDPASSFKGIGLIDIVTQ